MGGKVHKVDIGSLHEQICEETGDAQYAHIGYCKTHDQRADIFTKALEPATRPRALDLLGISQYLGHHGR